jgi:putative methionine-R-sulfoxide reductase with GAF domain
MSASDLERLANEVEVVRRVAITVNGSLDLERVLDAILEQLHAVFGFEHTLVLLTKEDETLEVVASRGYPTSGVGARVRLGEGPIGVAARRRKLLRLGAIRVQKQYVQTAGGTDIELPGLPDAMSIVVVPMLIDDELVGIFAVESNKPTAFDARDDGLVTTVATLAAAAVRNARFHADVQQRVRELERRKAEIETLNEELRRQIERRSRELGEALARGAQGYANATLEPGALVDERYRIDALLGAGAMGAVYRVRRITDEKDLALKVMIGAGDPVRFAREAEIAAQIRHPNVVPVVDVGIAREGFLYLVMELVRGVTLDDMREKFGDAAFARRVLADVASGLEALHARSIVHRDLKPSNVLLEEGGRVTARIADFGVARRGDALSPVAATVGARQVTAAGQLVGTPLYMAPECVKGADHVTSASDMFALGIIACELYTGRYPYVTPPVLQALAATPLTAPDLAGLPDDAAWIARALDPDPSKRPTAGEIAHALRRDSIHPSKSSASPSRG